MLGSKDELHSDGNKSAVNAVPLPIRTLHGSDKASNDLAYL